MKIRSSEPYRGQPAVSVIWIAVLLAALTFTRAQAQAPANDMYADRSELITDTNTLTAMALATNTLATVEPGEPPVYGSPATKSLWWDWWAPVDGYVIVSTSNSPSQTRVAVYDGAKELSLIYLATNLDDSGLPSAPDRFEFSAANGIHYSIAVDSRNGDSGAVELDLKVYTTPEISVPPPPSSILTAGQQAGLSVVALGNLPLNYQWQFSTLSTNAGFTNLIGSVNSVCAIGAPGVVSDANRGWYRVVISNNYGTITSDSVRVDVNDCAVPNPPQPSAVATNVGTTVSFTASALGTPPLSFQWQFQQTNQQGFINIPGATSTNLVMTNVSTDQAGEYQFLASNIACSNQASSVVTLTVSTNNALVLNPNLPADQTVITNSNVTNLVSVTTGFQPIGYQWWWSNLDSSFYGPLPGETGPALSLPDVQVANAGLYWAVVTNRYATNISRVARLTVQIRPPNDNFANRILFFPDWTNLPTNAISQTNVSGFNQNATAELGETSHQGFGPALSVWWSFTAPVDGQVNIDLTAPDAPQVLAAYSGSNLTSLVPVVAGSNTLTSYDFVATNHIEYVFAVDAQSASKFSTNINLSLTFNPQIGGPTIIKQPGGGSNVLGDPLVGCRTFAGFTVQATSLDGVVYYQWQFGPTTNGPFSDLPGMTNSILVLSNVTTLNQGWYRAQVSNRSTNVDSAAVYLTVDIGPIIDDQPQNATAEACATAQFQVTAESCTALQYQWRLNGTNVDAPNAQGAASATLVISNLTPASQGAYDVVVSNANLSVTSKPATLTLTLAPVITTQPQSITEHGCATATFSVAAAAGCPLTYQWLFQGTNLAGATNSTLTIDSVQPSNAGNYAAMVATSFTNVSSQAASLTVQTDPVIQQAPSSVTNRECDTVSLAVVAGAEPSCSFLTYQWQFDGTNITGATNHTYSFAASAQSAGQYQVVVSNFWTNIIAGPARVTVIVAPAITQQPLSSQRVQGGTAFSNTITVQGCSALSYQWQHEPPGGTNFSNVVLDANHQVGTNGWLVVSSAQSNDSGNYLVIASNIYTSVTSSVAVVQVVNVPGNDNFSNAFSLGSASNAFATGYNVFATAEPGEPDHGGQPPMHSVWWVWTNSFASLVTVNTEGSDIQTVLGVYTGTVVSNLTTIAEDANANGGPISFMAGGGTVLYFAVDGKNGAEGTNLMISVAATAITSPPVITVQPLNLAASPGQTITFTNEAYGSPAMSIQWYNSNGTPQAAVTTTFPTASPTNYLSTLTLQNISTNNEGLYYVVLSNNFGAVTSKLAALTFGSVVSGLVSDATETTTNGVAVGIPGALISVGNVSALTDQNGNYELVGVTLGSLHADFLADTTYAHLNEPVQFWDYSTSTAALLTATKEGYYDYVSDQVEVGQGQTVEQHIAMTPIFNGLRFVLTWTNVPADLDLLLYLPPTDPVDYPWITYLPTNQGSLTQPPYAHLDATSITGWGPDTITISKFYPGTYSLYANKFQGQGGAYLSQSDAQVVAYFGEDVLGGFAPLVPYGILQVPTAGTNDWWHICDIDGSTTNITWINELDPTPPGTSVATGMVVPLKASPLAPIRPLSVANATYQWDFGDGTGATNVFEPLHSYANPGWYTVSLQITETSGTPPKSDIMIKSNYIYVVDVPPTVAITNPLQNTIFRTGDPITLQSSAISSDDVITNVEYYLVSSQQTNYLGSASNAPYALEFLPDTNFEDSTNTLMALAYDSHGVASWSQPVSVTILDLHGDILILSISSSPEIEEMAADLGQLQITAFDASGNPLLPYQAIVKTLDHTGLYFGLVQDFKLIVWDDQGQVNPGLADNDVAVLQQAYGAGIPLYLTGEKLGQSANYLTNTQNFLDWSALVGFQQLGSIPGPLTIQGLEVPYEDGLFYGWDPNGVASTNLPVSSTLELLALTSSNFDVAAQISAPGIATNSPIMLRYPHFSDPNFGQTGLLVQDFRVTLDVDPLPAQDAASHTDRQILFINGAAWLLGMFACPDFSVDFECTDPPPLNGGTPDAQGNVPSGIAGQQMIFTTTISQNGSCPPGGVLVTNFLSPQLQIVSATIIPPAGVSTNTFHITIASNLAVAQFSELLGSYQFVTVAIPLTGGWVTNTYTSSQGKYYHGAPCSQVALIQAPACTAVLLSAYVDDDIVHLTVTGGAGCSLELQASTDLTDWVDLTPVQPNSDPYDVQIGPASNALRFYRLRKLP
jgi:uncharacterized repeat protein (TIGR01451 family)